MSQVQLFDGWNLEGVLIGGLDWCVINIGSSNGNEYNDWFCMERETPAILFLFPRKTLPEVEVISFQINQSIVQWLEFLGECLLYHKCCHLCNFYYRIFKT